MIDHYQYVNGINMLTRNYAINLLSQNQAMKEVTINNAINSIDFLTNRVVKKFIDELPTIFNANDIFVIKNAKQDLIQHENKIAFFIHGKWNFILPNPIVILYIYELKSFYLYDDTLQWTKAK